MGLDWKEDIPTLQWRLENAVRNNFGITINLPDPSEKYGPNASVSSCNAFADYDNILHQQGLQMGFIDTESDEYVIIVHRMDDREEIKKAVNKTGYKYMYNLQFTKVE